jgi:hypothetical protein
LASASLSGCSGRLPSDPLSQEQTHTATVGERASEREVQTRTAKDTALSSLGPLLLFGLDYSSKRRGTESRWGLDRIQGRRMGWAERVAVAWLAACLCVQSLRLAGLFNRRACPPPHMHALAPFNVQHGTGGVAVPSPQQQQWQRQRQSQVEGLGSLSNHRSLLSGGLDSMALSLDSINQ